MPRAPRALLIAVLLSIGALAHAQPSESEGAASRAEKLFREGVDALERNEFSVACDKFEQSLKLVTRASTLLNLGTCESEQGKLATAYKHYQEGMALLPPNDERLAATTKLIDELSTRVPKLSVSLKEGTPAGARVVIDGHEIAPGELDAVKLDPGKHEVVLTVPKHKDSSVSIVLAERDKKSIELAPGPVEEAPPPPPKPNGGKKEPGPELAVPGYVIGAIGIAAAIAAGVTGGIIVSNDSTIQESCPNQRCNPEGSDLVDQNNTLLIVNAVTFGVAGAGIATGAALLIADAVMNSDDEETGLLLGPTFVGIHRRF